LGKEYRPFSSSCNFLHSPVTSSLLDAMFDYTIKTKCKTVEFKTNLKTCDEGVCLVSSSRSLLGGWCLVPGRFM
jgi:hypothetical protein